MLEIAVILLFGLAGTLIYRLKRENTLTMQAYFNGWKDRHQGVPLLPRYWRFIQIYNYDDPVDQMRERALMDAPKGSYGERVRDGVPPFYDRTCPAMNYAISDSEIALLRDRAEQAWRGIWYDEEDGQCYRNNPWDYNHEPAVIKRNPSKPLPEDVVALLSYELEINDIENYYRVDGLVLIKNKLGKIKQVLHNA